MQFDIELVAAEFIFLMNPISILESFLPWRTPEPISDGVTYILVLWLLNPFTHIFPNTPLSPVLYRMPSVPFWRWWQRTDIVQESFVARKSTLKSKLSWVLYSCLSLQQHHSMQLSCFWLLSEFGWVVPIQESRCYLYLLSLLCIAKDVKIRNYVTLISWPYCQPSGLMEFIHQLFFLLKFVFDCYKSW